MVADPRQAAMLQQMLTAGAGTSPETDARVRSARLSSAATIAAARGQCKCKPCRYLRKMVDLTMEDAERELGADAPGDDPPA